MGSITWMKRCLGPVLLLLASAVPAEPEFGGVIGATLAESTPSFEQPIRAAPDSPNVIYILLDDTAFADLGSFGSEIRTPNLDALAEGGLRYNNFYTRAVCSPSRAALLTGRNSHSAGMGNLSHVVTGFPGKRGRMVEATATVAEMLREGGYSTYAAGKWHVVPLSADHSPAVLRDWPVQRGFDRYYGFMAMTDHFHPSLYIDNTPIDPPRGENYHLTVDLVDKSIGFIASHLAMAPERPFFLYFAPGATHAPHHAPAEFIERYASVYDKGWDATREARFERQKQLGIVPQDAKLPPRDPQIPRWETLSPDERRVAARMQATYAGFLEHTDAELGRLLAFLDKAGLREDTLIVVMSDNGASREGGVSGTTNMTFNIVNFARKTQDPAELAKSLADIGSERSYGNYPLGWAMVSNTPFSNYKHSVDMGGVRAPLIVSWPGKIRDLGAVRDQFVDIIDITPTVLELTKVDAPKVYRGVEQKPVEGRSIAASFADPDAPPARQVQYFELWGRRSIWRDGWWAVARHEKGTPFENDRWALYDLRKDFSASTDVSERYPDQLKKLQDAWWEEARKYAVLPVDDRQLADFGFGSREDKGRVYRFYPSSGFIDQGWRPRIVNRSFSMKALVDRKSEKSDGVLMATGDRFGGYVFYVRGGKLFFELNDFGKPTTIASTRPVPVGPATLEYRFVKIGDFKGTGELLINGESAGSAPIAMTPASILTWAGSDIGRDVGSPVSEAYREAGSFDFPKGELEEVQIQIID